MSSSALCFSYRRCRPLGHRSQEHRIPRPIQPPPSSPTKTCLGYHGLQGFATVPTPNQAADPDGAARSLSGSVHGKRLCVECHNNITEIPHEKVDVKVSCVQCHEDAVGHGAGREQDQGESRKLGVVVQHDRPLHEIDPCAAEQGGPVAHQRHLLQLPRRPLRLSEGQR